MKEELAHAYYSPEVIRLKSASRIMQTNISGNHDGGLINAELFNESEEMNEET